MNLAIRGEMGPAGGWFGRSQRLVEGVGKECVEQGYLLVPVAFQQQAMGDFDASYDAAAGATEIGRRFGDADLCALAGHIQGLYASSRVGSRKAWACSTKRWWRSSRERCRRC